MIATFIQEVRREKSSKKVRKNLVLVLYRYGKELRDQPL